MKKYISYLLFLTCLVSTAQPGYSDTTYGTNGAALLCDNYAPLIRAGLQSDEKLVYLASSGGIDAARLGRISAQGELDNSFGTGGYVRLGQDNYPALGSNSGYSPVDIAIQPDDKIVFLGRRFIGFDWQVFVIRMLPDGTPDPSFNGTGYRHFSFGYQLDIGHCIGIQPDGKIVIAGTSGEGQSLFALARLNQDGSFDSGFGTNGIVLTEVPGSSQSNLKDIAFLPDGRIVVGGDVVFTKKQYAAARYLPNGTLDPTFGWGGIAVIPNLQANGSEVFRCMAVRTDGRIILGGQTNTYLEANAEQGIGLVQLTTGGQLDNTYGTGGISIVETQWYDAIDIVLQADQKLLMAIGEAETGYPSARFLPNGSLDSGYGNNGIAIVPLTMQSYSGFITVLPDNKILLGGLTVDPNNENSACAFVMRLDPGTLSVNGNQANSVDIYPNPTTASAFFDNSKAAFSKAFVYNALGQDVSQIDLQPFENQEINLAELSAGVYFVRLENDVYQQIFRLIKE